MSEQHRYFPDWTLRSLTIGQELEADDNSYLAGGYAEEFGYRARFSSSLGASELDGDVPEPCRELRSPAYPVHPGYPFKAHPIATDSDIGRDGQARAAVTRSDGAADPYELVTERSGTFTFLVSTRSHMRNSGALPRASIASIRLAAAWVALRWALRHR